MLRVLSSIVGAILVMLPLHAGAGLGLSAALFAEGDPPTGAFALVANGQSAPLWLDAEDFAGVHRAAGDLKADVERVTTIFPALSIASSDSPPSNTPVIIGTVGKNAVIDSLISSGKLATTDLTGKWESFVITTIEQPLPGVDRALVIAGSDKRGTIFGIYELSEQLGVSPWYWWADVPAKTRSAAYVVPGRFASGEPVVKYRGIFLNDEAPALSGWSTATFGDRNQAFYAKVFELMLRLRGNYLWPAMWSDAFNEDDPGNAALADQFGIVMGTSHHEPMLRSQQEWSRHKTSYGNGTWDYQTNEAGLKSFWSDGIARNKDFESIVTIGMRGDGDAPMDAGGDMTSNVNLLSRIIDDQRNILMTETGLPASQTPQIWALYKEVLDYYDFGMRVADDVTHLWPDDNWGNLRRVPTATERTRSGGAGVYYHFDYVGGPRNYKWMNTNPLPKVQEQMNLAWHYGATKIWIVNVGDLKPMEVPMEFFLRMAWDPARWASTDTADYMRQWATREFGAAYADEVAAINSAYLKFNGRRKPELLDPSTFNLHNYREAERVRQDWRDLTVRAETLHTMLPAAAKDAFYQLVLHPVKACAIVNDLYVTTALNNLYSNQQRASTNTLASQSQALFQADADLVTYWNTSFAGGKWVNMMNQVHIGYTTWSDPEQNILPPQQNYAPPSTSDLGVALEGSSTPLFAGGVGVLPRLSSEGGAASRYIELFRRGTLGVVYSITADQPWVNITNASGSLGDDARSEISIDWSRAPTGKGDVTLTIQAADSSTARTVRLPFVKAAVATTNWPIGFLDPEGYIAIEAPHFDRAITSGGIDWRISPDLGRTLGGVFPVPVTADSVPPGDSTARLEYDIYLDRKGELSLRLIVSPSLNITPGRGLRCAVSLDNQPPQIVEVGGVVDDGTWSTSVKDSVRTVNTSILADAMGPHVLKVWMVDPGVVLQRIEIDTGGLKPSYLGPPESPRGRRAPTTESDPEASVGSLMIEAESGELGSEFPAFTSSVPGYISASTDNTASSPAAAERVATYQLIFPAAGTYRLFARVRVGPNPSNDDSFFFGNGFGVKNPTISNNWKMINGGPGYANRLDVVTATATSAAAAPGLWKWMDLSGLSGGTTFTVAAGFLTKTFQIGGRENGIDIDKFVFAPAANTLTVEDLMQGGAGTPPGSIPVPLEAESSSFGSEFLPTTGTPTSIGITTNATGSSPASAARVARFQVNFSAAASYRLLARVQVGPGGANDDSLFVGAGFGAKDPTLSADWKTVNNFSGQGFYNATDVVSPTLNGTAGSGVWKWIDLSKLSGIGSFNVTADGLVRTLDIGGRENGLDIDKLVFVPATHVYTVADLDTGAAGIPAASSMPVITASVNEIKQAIDGFGASSAWNPTIFSDAQADLFFSESSGLGLSLLRIRVAPTGTTVETGTALKAVARGTKVWATPWTPPAAWKSNGDVNNGGFLLPEYHDDWAARLADFTLNLQTAGVPLLALSAQNEPNYTAVWESCVWTPAELTGFIRDHLGPALASRGVATRVLAAEPIGWNSLASYSDALLADAGASAYLTHVATHHYTGSPFAYPAAAANGKSLWQTEYSDGAASSDPTIDSGLRVANTIHDFLTVSEGNAWHYWWLQQGNTTASTGALTENGVLAKRGWAMGNWARFVRPGHRRVQTYGSTDTIRATAFVSPTTRRMTVVAVNSDNVPRSVPIAIDGGTVVSLTPWETSASRSLESLAPLAPAPDGSFTLPLPARSVTTFVSESLNRPPIQLALDHDSVDENLPTGTWVGNLSATDADPGETFTLALTNGAGDTDNAAFSIVGNQLQTAAPLDFESSNTLTLRIRATDSAGSYVEQDFVITVGNSPFEYTDWSASLPPSERDPAIDTDGDGYPNLLTYAFGYAPHQMVPAGNRPVATLMDGDSIRFTFIIPADAPPDMLYRIEQAYSLGAWTVLAAKDGNGAWEGSIVPESIPTPEGRTRVSLITPLEKNSVFFRLRASLPNSPQPP